MKSITKKITIDPTKKYQFPKDIRKIIYNSKILIINVENARWIVLDNELQYTFFSLLLSNDIQNAIRIFGDNDDSRNVLIQLEAKDFVSEQVVKSINGQRTMHFYLTNSCNMRCPHCYMFAGQKLDNELSTEEVLRVLEEFAHLGGTKVTFSGGEISIRPDLEDIIRNAHCLGLEVNLLTNGTLWDEKKVSEISSYVKSVQISIDGFDEYSNSRVRGAGNFDKALNAVRYFSNQGVKTEVSIVPFFDDNLEKDIDKYVSFSKHLVQDYRNVSVRFATELLDGRNIKLTNEEKAKYSNIVTQIYSAYYGEDMYDFPFIQQRKNGHVLNNCMFGEIAISANGDVFPCSRVLSATPLGNLHHTSLSDIIPLAHKAEQLSDIDRLKPCNECELKYICGGGCRIDFFPLLLESDISSISYDDIPPRKCSQENKNHFYDLMIKTNTRLFQ